MNSYRECPGCKTLFPYQKELPAELSNSGIIRYGVGSPECQTAFNDVLAFELSHFGYPSVHRLLIDAYAVQHPPHFKIQQALGIPKRLIDASTQSIIIHLIALYVAFEKKLPLKNISGIMNQILSTGISFEQFSLTVPVNLGNKTIKNIKQEIDASNIQNLEDYIKLITEWAQLAWNAWSPHHKTIQKWYEKYT